MRPDPRFPSTIAKHFNAIEDPATRANFLKLMDTALATVTTAGVRAQQDYSSGGNTGHNQFKVAISALEALRDAEGITDHREYISGQIFELNNAGASAKPILLNKLRVNLASTITKLDQAEIGRAHV